MIHKLWNHDHIITHKDQAFFIFQNCSTYLDSFSVYISSFELHIFAIQHIHSVIHISLWTSHLCTLFLLERGKSYCNSFKQVCFLKSGSSKRLCIVLSCQPKSQGESVILLQSLIKSDCLVQQATFFTAFTLVQFLNSVTMIWFRRYSSHEHLFIMSPISSCILVNKVPFQSLHLQ